MRYMFFLKNTDKPPIISTWQPPHAIILSMFHLLLIGGQLGMAFGSATRDVHVFNSIIGVYQLSYRRVQCAGGGKSPVGTCMCTE